MSSQLHLAVSNLVEPSQILYVIMTTLNNLVYLYIHRDICHMISMNKVIKT